MTGSKNRSGYVFRPVDLLAFLSVVPLFLSLFPESIAFALMKYYSLNRESAWFADRVKLIQFFSLFSFLLLFYPLAFRFCERRSWSTHCFPFLTCFTSILLLVGFRFIIGSGFTGVMAMTADNFEYASFAQQARYGAFLFGDLFTVQPHPEIYFNPYFLIVGILARILNCSVFPIMIVSGIVGAALVILLVYYAARATGWSEGAARWATVLAAFSSGVSLIVRAVTDSVPVGADFRYLDAILFSTFYASPYHSFTFGLVTLLIFLILIWSQEDKTVNNRRRFAILGLLTMFVSFVHPYEIVMICASYSGYCSVVYIRRRTIATLHVPAVILAASIPVIVYQYWVSQQPVWSYFADVSLSHKKFPLYWITGYGLLIPLSLYGIYSAFRDRRLEKTWWLGIALLWILFLLIVLNVRQSKISSGAHIYMSLFAGYACSEIVKRIRSISVTGFRRTAIFIFGLLCSGLFVNVPFQMLCLFQNNRFHYDFEVAVWDIRAISRERFPKVLCDMMGGIVLPGIGGIRVYSGHVSMTPGYFGEKYNQLTRAGFEPFPKQHAGRVADFETFKTLVKSALFDFILAREDMPAFTFAERMPGVKRVQCYYERCLWSIQPVVLNPDPAPVSEDALAQTVEPESARFRRHLLN